MLIGEEGVHALVLQKAQKNGVTFGQQLNNMVKKKEITQTTAKSVSFGDPEVRGNEIKKGFLDMEDFAEDSWDFRKRVRTLMGVESGEMYKKLEKLKLDELEKLLIGLMGELRHVEERFSCRKVNLLELYGHAKDQIYLLNCIILDVWKSRFINDGGVSVIRNVAATIADPKFNLSTTKGGSAKMSKKDNIVENKELEVDMKAMMGDSIPPPASDTNVYVRKGKLYYDIMDYFEVESELTHPMTDCYCKKRYLWNEEKSGECKILDKIKRGEKVHLDPSGKYCLAYHSPRAEWAPKCKDSNCWDKKTCLFCGGGHSLESCRAFQASHANIEGRKDWMMRVICRKVEKLHVPLPKRGSGGFYDNNNYNYNNYGGSRRSYNYRNYRNNRGRYNDRYNKDWDDRKGGEKDNNNNNDKEKSNDNSGAGEAPERKRRRRTGH